MVKFVEVAKTNDLKPSEGKVVDVEGTAVALFNVNGKFYAIDNTCLHEGGPLGEGELDGKIVTCPWHGWRYDVTTGKNLVLPISVKKYQVKVENNKILVSRE